MKKAFLLTWVIAVLLLGCGESTQRYPSNSINAILGDQSFVATFGQQPTAQHDEFTRIQTHLAYVEKLLRNTDVNHLPEALQVKRMQYLDLLHAYWTAGCFPKNYDYPDSRKPCFIDVDGNICAVGYLAEQSKGRDFAELVNASFKYASIHEIDLPAFLEWVSGTGLTLNEMAMIQPTYGSPAANEPIANDYAIGTAVWSGVNIALITINGTQIINPGSSKFIPYAGFASGAGQITYGILQYPSDNSNAINTTGTNNGTKAVSMVNIGLGTGTLLVSLHNYLHQRSATKEKKTAWNVYSFPGHGKQMGVGFSLTKRF